MTGCLIARDCGVYTGDRDQDSQPDIIEIMLTTSCQVPALDRDRVVELTRDTTCSLCEKLGTLDVTQGVGTGPSGSQVP